MIRMLNGDEGWLDNQPDNIEPADFFDLSEGQTAEGNMNFTSIEPSQHAILTQLDNGDEYVETRDSFPDVNYVVDDVSTEVQDEEHAMEHETQPSYICTTLRANGEKIVKKTKSTPRERVEKAVKRIKRSNVVDMMASYLEMRKKQSEEKAVALSREREEAKMREEASKVDDCSIKSCISVVEAMEELSNEEKVKSFGVFKDS
ncbi:hypothetical protein E2562_012536 [Oryza meyeriana var. granulata]|uniref:No apical meristem-associated C-terminal domain-containing protein n=1 Tax=Oryza meyeriana var. granulata TaxID=110450 RepID=A0A6G1D2S5_9ORYZ|nr:hypothetical protein E2562_012536 [Oryza meyeriana var. granulata]